MIPGFIITWITFPGVIVHEFAHALFCKLFGMDIFEVRYFIFSVDPRKPAGYVLHRPSAHAWQNAVVGIGPLFVNTILGAIIAAPSAYSVLKFESRHPLDLFLAWLGISIAMHSFPSTGDAASIWKSVTGPETPFLTKLVGVPLVGLIYIGAIGSVFWLDAIYGVAVACFLPWLIVNLIA